LQQGIINLMWNKKGNFLDSLLPVTQFQKHIQEITLNMPSGLQLPTLDPLELGRTAKVKARTTKSAILFHVKIPLISQNILRAYQVYQLPVVHSGRFVSINPVYKYILVDEARTVYYGMSEDNWEHCQKMEELTICEQRHPLFNCNKATKCEVLLLAKRSPIIEECYVNVMMPETTWHQLHQPNSWLFSASTKIIADVFCADKTSTLELTGVGILQLQAGCYLHSEHVSLWAFEDRTSDVSFW
ncbi:hypothetical protein KR222_006902, partial [Zaprionus bogoriensis]